MKKFLEILLFHPYVYHKWQSYDAWFLRYIAQRTDFFVTQGHFLPFYPTSHLEHQNFEKMKKCLEILSFYTCVPQMTIIWCTVLEIRSATDRIFCHFGPFFPFYPSNNLQNHNSEKLKKAIQDITILLMSTINDDHLMYGSWDMECHGQNCLLFWTNFYPFTPLTTQKIKILIKWKQKQKHLEISLFYTSVPKIVIICYTVPAIWRVMDVIFFILGYFFCPFTPLTTQKIKILKNWTNSWIS